MLCRMEDIDNPLPLIKKENFIVRSHIRDGPSQPHASRKPTEVDCVYLRAYEYDNPIISFTVFLEISQQKEMTLYFCVFRARHDTSPPLDPSFSKR